MERCRKWLFWALGILLSIVGLTGLTNYILDPYGLLRKDFTYQFIEPNKNFIKIRFITQNPDRYDSFVFGSSRVNNINVRKIQGYKCYNVHYSGGLPRDHLDNIRYLLKKKVKTKLILIGLDEFSFREDPDARLRQPLRCPPALAAVSWLSSPAACAGAGGSSPRPLINTRNALTTAGSN